MKRVILVATIVFAPFALSAQEVARLPGNWSIDRGFLTAGSLILFMYLISAFITTIIKSIQEFRLKSKLIDRGVPENVVKQFIQPTTRDSKTQAMKWFLVLAAIGLGLTIINFTQPFGFHSVAIMAFCIAFSFLGYFFYIKMAEK